MTQVVVYLTSPLDLSSSYTVPSDWDPNGSNTIETIGGGGGGYNGASGSSGAGGGGGAYSKITNLALTPGASVNFFIGSGGVGGASPGNGGDTFFNGASLAAASVGAKGGAGAVNQTAGAG